MINISKFNEFEQNAVFESLRTYNGKVFKFQEHIHRLEQSAKAVGLILPPPKKIENKIKQAIKKSSFADAFIRVSFSKGGGLTIIIKSLPIYPKEYYENGVEILTVPTTRNIPSAIDANIKCSDFLSGVMVKIESRRAFEAIFLNKDGYVTEGTVSNIFIKTHNTGRFCFITPPSYLGVLEGITKKFVIEIAEKSGIPIEEKPFTRYNLYTSSECFLTNTSMEIMPVTKVDARIIGSGKPGASTLKLRNEFRKVVTK